MIKFWNLFNILSGPQFVRQDHIFSKSVVSRTHFWNPKCKFCLVITLGVCPFTLPARAREPWTLPGNNHKHDMNRQDMNPTIFMINKLLEFVNFIDFKTRKTSYKPVTISTVKNIYDNSIYQAQQYNFLLWRPNHSRLFHTPTSTTSSGCLVLHRTVHALWNLYGNPYRNRAEKEEETVMW